MVFVCSFLRSEGIWDGWCCPECHTVDQYGPGGWVHIIAGCNVAICCGVEDALDDKSLTYDQVLEVVRKYDKEFPSAD